MKKKNPSLSKPKARPIVQPDDGLPGKKVLFPIVGIGASAGGLEAYRELLQHVPGDIGMGFVLVQHLAPKHESALSELLSRFIKIPVAEVKDGMAVEPNHVYVIPPNMDMVILGGILRLTPRSMMLGQHMPIDYFLRSLATDRGTQAIGVILSGTGSDGTLGMKAIKAEGGITLAQDVETAKYPDMPRSAASAGCVDFVLPVKEIARELDRLGRHPYITRARPPEAREVSPQAEDELDRTLALLRNHSGVNFALYKQSTIKRRVWRRMALHKIHSPREYVRFLQANPDELNALYQDILIHVTGFFRDPETFEALKTTVFPAITAGRGDSSPVRVWVPGCSTGEEAYSIAIALLEFLGDRAPHVSIQVFATDISEMAVERARSGIYLENITADVSPERLRRFFVKGDQGYRISKSIRDMCVFAGHDVTRDPPFSRLDLISCRNLLIYLGPPLQKRVLPFFVYALKPGGFLLLGTSEHIAGSDEYFTLVDKKNKIYSRKLAVTRPFFDLTSTGLLAGRDRSGKRRDDVPTGFDVQKEVDRVLLAKYTPAGVIVNADLQILQFRGQTGPFLEPSPGQASLTLPKMAREGLLVDLRAAIHKAQKEGTVVRKEGIRVKWNGRTLEASIEVVPLKGPSARDRYFLVLFQEIPHPPPAESPRAKTARERRREAVEAREIPRLKEDLSQTRAALQSVIEGQDTTNEELRSANEEILSSNEELQSTNEELETAKEELQSANEELRTVNEELQNRNVQLSVTNNDLTNLLASVQIPIIMVGGDLCIRRSTPLAEKIFNIIPSDVGRPLGHLRPKVEVPDLEALVTESIDTVSTREREVQDREGRWYSLRVRPYLTADNRIDGAVLTLLDIDALKAEVNESRIYAEAIVETVQTPFIVLDGQLKVRAANHAFFTVFGVSGEETKNRFIYELGNGQWNIPKLRELLEEILPTQTSFSNFAVEHEFPSIGRKTMLLNARTIRQSHTPGQLILLAIEDITERERSLVSLRQSQAMFEKLFEEAPDALVASGRDGRIARVNLQVDRMFGYERGELLGKPVEILLPGRFKDAHPGHRHDFQAKPRIRPMGGSLDLFGRRKDGSDFPVDVMLSPMETEEGTLVLAVVRDIADRKRAEDALRLLVEVTAAASEAEDLRTMPPRCLEIFCRLGGWQVAQGWFLDERQNVLRCDSRAFYSEIAATEFRKSSLETTFAEGQGLIGQAWKGKEPVWIADIAAGAGKMEFARKSRALEAGLRSAFTLPIRVDQRLHAIWEFFSSTKRSEDPHFLEVARRLGNHLAIVYERKMAEKALGDLSARLMKSQDEERQRIAHELHDEAGQLLATVHIALDGAARDSSPAGRKSIHDVKELLDQIEVQLRRLSHELRPTILDDLGLLPALEFLAEGVSKRSGIPVSVEGDTKGRLPAQIEIALYRVVQEALNNVVKHAMAKQVEVRLLRQDNTVRCSITDDGVGFDAQALRGQKGERGLGLIGMRERVLGVRGSCIVNTAPGEGTQIMAIIPVESSGADSNPAGR